MPAPTPRTTGTLVAGIIEVDPAVDLTPFIMTATVLTTTACGGHGYSDDGVNSQMEIIERWLAAHFYAIRDTQLTFAKAGTANVGFQTKLGLGLRLTSWGQQALILDTSGSLAAIENSAEVKKVLKVYGFWGGTCYPPYFRKCGNLI